MIIELTPAQLSLLSDAVQNALVQERSLRLEVRENAETIAWKVGEGMWTPGYGFAAQGTGKAARLAEMEDLAARLAADPTEYAMVITHDGANVWSGQGTIPNVESDAVEWLRTDGQRYGVHRFMVDGVLQERPDVDFWVLWCAINADAELDFVRTPITR